MRPPAPSVPRSLPRPFPGPFLQAHSNLGTALKGLGRHAEATAHTRATRRSPCGAVRGTASSLSRQAAASYSAAIRLKPHLCEAHKNLGAALTELGRPRDAVASFATALDINPQFWPACRRAAAAPLRLEGRPADTLRRPCPSGAVRLARRAAVPLRLARPRGGDYPRLPEITRDYPRLHWRGREARLRELERHFFGALCEPRSASRRG